MFVKVNNSKFAKDQVVFWDHSPEHVEEFPDNWKDFDGAHILCKGDGDETVYEIAETVAAKIAVNRGFLIKVEKPNVEEEEKSTRRKKA